MAESPFDELAEKYDAWYDGKGKLVFQIELAALRPLLADLPKPWIEVGVGTGRFAKELGIPTGVDPSAGLLAKAQERGIDVMGADGEELPFKAGTFGTVFLLTTWAFLEDPLTVLNEARRVLKPDGQLVNGYLDREGKWGASYVEKGKKGHPLFSHAHFATYSEVKETIEKAGFEITKTVSTLFQEPGQVKELEQPKPGHHRGASFVVVVARKLRPL